MAQTPFIGRHGLKSLGTLEVDGQSIFNDTITINGDVVQNGATYETHTEQLFTKNDEVITRDGAVGALGAGEYSGFRVKLYDGANDGRLVVGNDGIARVGDDVALQAIATREDVPIDVRVPYWDSATQSFKTDKPIFTTATGGLGVYGEECIRLQHSTELNSASEITFGSNNSVGAKIASKRVTLNYAGGEGNLEFYTQDGGTFADPTTPTMVLDEKGVLNVFNTIDTTINGDPNLRNGNNIVIGSNLNGGLLPGGGIGLKVTDKTSNSGSSQTGTGVYISSPYDGANATGGTYSLIKHGLYIDDLYSYYGINNPTGNSNWGVYVKGGARNYFQGGVTIGTDSVSSVKLRVKSTPTVEGTYLRYQALLSEDSTVATGRGGGIAFGLGESQLAGIKAYTPTASTDNSELRFITKKAGVFSENMVLDENGNLVIGNSSARGKIDIPNAFYINSSNHPYFDDVLAGTGTNLVISTSDGQLLKDSSSVRYKENFAPLSIDSSIIYDINVCEYNYIDTGDWNFSGIAEQISEQVSDKLVFKDSEGNPDAISNPRVQWLMLEEMKKLNDRIKELESQLQII